MPPGGDHCARRQSACLLLYRKQRGEVTESQPYTRTPCVLSTRVGVGVHVGVDVGVGVRVGVDVGMYLCINLPAFLLMCSSRVLLV